MFARNACAKCLCLKGQGQHKTKRIACGPVILVTPLATNVADDLHMMVKLDEKTTK